MSTTRKQCLYDTLRSFRDGATRRDLAVALGIQRLTPADTLLLELMAEAGQIHLEKQPRAGGIAYQYRYRVAEATKQA